MKIKLAITVGIAIGTAAYQVFWYGVSELDLARPLFVAMLALLLLLPVPNRWISKSNS